MEPVMFAAAVGAGLWAVLSSRRSAGARPALAVGALLVLGSTVAVALRAPAGLRRAASLEERRAAVPAPRRDDGFVGSDACRACHPGPYATWHASYHRTMTQLAGPDAVLGSFDDVTVPLEGGEVRLSRRGEEYWADLVNPLWEELERRAGRDPRLHPDPPRVERRVLMTTGSHHMQFYWIDSGLPRSVLQLPVGFLRETGQWVPTKSTFIQPPDKEPGVTFWNTTCIKCHAVAGQPIFDEQTSRSGTRVADLGIACEACHGPGGEHVRVNRDPLRRYARHFDDAEEDTIVDPRALPPARASESCGQCHSIAFDPDVATWNREGSSFRAGDVLEQKTRLARHPARTGRPFVAPDVLADDPHLLEDSFWPDGIVRVSGRDFSALVDSPCYEKGAISCLDCHSMHGYAARADQLTAGAGEEDSCRRCHASLFDDVATHTRHRTESEGSRCLNCHMPHTTYGLLKAIRSHTIASPSAVESVEHGRPNACSLCHLDRTLEWTAVHLREWYGQPLPPLDPDSKEIAAGLRWMLEGDAGQRALLAWHAGWEPAQRASGRDWIAPHLAHLLADPYDAVRFIAGRSLATLPGFADFRPDYMAPPARREAARREAIRRWLAREPPAPAERDARRLLDEAGRPRADRVARLLERRDDRRVVLAE